MKRKPVLIGTAIGFLAVLAVAYLAVFGYAVSTPVSERITLLTRNGLFGQVGANVVAYVGDTDSVVVDSQLSALASATRSRIDRLARTSVAALFITHWHPDHSGGIAEFSQDTRVIGHENVLKRLSSPQEGFGLTKPGSYHHFDARPTAGLPTETVADRLIIATGSGNTRAVHYPAAHTDGDLVIYFPAAGVAAIGDLVWPGAFPYVDVHNGGTAAGLESALTALLAAANPNDRFIPGHGPVQSYDDLAEYLEMVSGTRRWVERQLAAGQTKSQIVTSGLPAEWDMWSSRLVPVSEWIEMIVASSNSALAAEQ